MKRLVAISCALALWGCNNSPEPIKINTGSGTTNQQVTPTSTPIPPTSTPTTNVEPGDNEAPVIKAPSQVSMTVGLAQKISITVSDDQSQSVNVTWNLIERPTDGDMLLRVGDNITEVFFTPSSPGNYVVQIEANDGEKTTIHTVTIVATELTNGSNLAPTYSDFSFLSSQVFSDTDTEVYVSEVSDPNGDSVVVSYHWTVNGEVINTNGSILPASFYQKGDAIEVYGVLSDGELSVTTASLLINVSNSLPQLTGLTVSPPIANTTNEVSALQSVSVDPDGDQVQISYEWIISGQDVPVSTTNTLPAYTAAKGDLVTLKVSVSDGEGALTNTFQMEIQDAPAQMTVPSLAKQVEHGQSINAAIEVVDPDGDSLPNMSLAYGPASMTVQDGAIKWQVNEVMFQPLETVNFGIKNDSTGKVTPYSVLVSDPQRKQITGRMGLEVPYEASSMLIADFDNDQKQELLVADNQYGVYTLERINGELVQDWASPFAIVRNSIKSVDAVEWTGDGVLDAVFHSASEIAVHNFVEQKSQVIYQSDAENIVSSKVADVDNDGVNDVLVIEQTQGRDASATIKRLAVGESETIVLWQTQLDVSLDYSTIAVGNVQGDQHLELVTGSGYVIDTAAGKVVWKFGSGFGNTITLANTNNDLYADIIATSRWPNPVIYNVTLQSEVGELPEGDICALASAQLDSDNMEEVIAIGCQSRYVHVYDVDGSSVTEKSKIRFMKSGAGSIVVGDLNQDDLVELYWGSGTGSTGADALFSWIEGDTTYYTPTQPQLDYFELLGFYNETPEEVKTAFIVPETESGYDGTVLATLSGSGELNISSEKGTNWSGNRAGLVADLNDDGYDELIYSTANIRDGFIGITTPGKPEVVWPSIVAESMNARDQIEVADLNDDQSKELVYSAGSRLQILNVDTQAQVWQSVAFTGLATFAVDDLNNKIYIATNNELSRWTEFDGNYVREITVAASCSGLSLWEGALLCESSSTSYGSTLHRVQRYDLDLKSLASFTFAEDVSAVIGLEGGENVLLAEQVVFDSARYFTRPNAVASRLKIVNLNGGNVIWQSPLIPGRVSKNGMQLLAGGTTRLAISTNRMMFVSH